LLAAVVVVGGRYRLKDGRQLENALRMTGRYLVGDVKFEPSEIETIEDVT
jgi:hypothetical protein